MRMRAHYPALLVAMLLTPEVVLCAIGKASSSAGGGSRSSTTTTTTTTAGRTTTATTVSRTRCIDASDRMSGGTRCAVWRDVARLSGLANTCDPIDLLTHRHTVPANCKKQFPSTSYGFSSPARITAVGAGVFVLYGGHSYPSTRIIYDRECCG